MILICVNNRTDDAPAGYDISQVTDSEDYYNLTIGKSYMLHTNGLRDLSSMGKPHQLINEMLRESTLILIQDDFGHIGFFPKHCFKSLDEIRDEKINLILDGK